MNKSGNGTEFFWESFLAGYKEVLPIFRFGQFTDAYQEKPVTDETKTLYPLPTSAVDVNENLTQNPGY